MNDEDFEKQLKTDFLIEADEILQKCEQIFLSIFDSSDPRRLLNEMFRFAHTLKGSGLAAGFESFGAFAHKLENVLDLLRTDKLAVDKAVIEVVLLAVDQLKDARTTLSSDFGASLNFEDIEGKLLEISGVTPLFCSLRPPWA